MPSVTYDGRSFMIDGRRTWLVSGSIHYARIPRELWADRIWSARMAGLNCIETPVFWNRHEPRSGQFDFTGDNDIRHFIELIGRAGMYCILRPGPFVGAEWDMGGLPPWLLAVKDVKLRTANQPFLEACSRYITALSEQVRDLQITSPGPPPPLGGGPIILVQNEAAWFGGDDKEALTYLGELARYLRESGFNVPTVNSNNLWQGVEGEIDCWAGGGDLLGILRQLATVRPDQPRLVIDFQVGSPAVWGVPGSGAPETPGIVQQRLAQILAAGGQFNLQPFHGGTNFGFWGGRLADHNHAYVAASRDHGAPLSETGIPNPGYAAVRRLCTFASRFGRIFANLDPTYRPVILAPGTAPDNPTTAPVALVYTSGPQGSIAFIFTQPQDENAEGPARTHALILPDGTTVPVHIGRDGLAWCIFDAFLAGRARLDYCGMSAFAMLGKVLAVFGPAGTEGELSINGSPLHVHTPKGRAAPAVIEHEDITVLVCSEEQIDTAFITDDAIFVGAAGITRDGEPIAMPGARQCLRVSSDGTAKNVNAQQQSHPAAIPAAIVRSDRSASRNGDKVTLSDWMMAPTTEHCDGTSPRFASIDGPADLTTLGSPYGYGWYRLRLKSPPSGKVRLAIPHGDDRLHLFLGGDSVGVLGYGHGASPDLSFSSRKSQNTLVVLAENLGRFSSGRNLGEPKGIVGDIWQISAVKAGKPSFNTGEPLDVLAVHAPIFEVQPGDLTHPERITWTFQHRRKSPVIVSVGAFPGRAILIANERTVGFIERGGDVRFILDGDYLRAGTNTVQLALIPEHGGHQTELDGLLAAAAGSVSFCEAANNISEGAEWAFAKWEMPRPTAYQKFKPGTARGCPTWWRAFFRHAATGQALLLEAAGLTKGQLYINQRHVSRYFVATSDGKHVPPQQLYYIPSPWLRPDEENELVLFDEHGGNPARCRLLYENSHQ